MLPWETVEALTTDPALLPLQACQDALLRARDQHPNLSFVLDEALAACGDEVMSEAERLAEVAPPIWAAKPLLLCLPLFFAAYAGCAAWLTA